MQPSKPLKQFQLLLKKHRSVDTNCKPKTGLNWIIITSLQADRHTDVFMTMSFFSACNRSSPSPSTHLCPPVDIFHSCVPRLCPPCSSTCPGWYGWAAHARSPWTRTLSGSTGRAQLEIRNLTEETRGFHLGMRIPFWNENVITIKWKPGYPPTHRFLSNTKPALQEHLKLPSVFRQSPFWQTPCMEHSLISSRSGGGV